MPRKRREGTWLETRDNGFYYIFRYNPDRKRIDRYSLNTKDFADAQRQHAQYILSGDTRFTVRTLDDLTVSAALDDYLREHCNALDAKGRTLVANPTRQENAITHLKAWFKNEPIKSIGPLESRAYADARRNGVIGGGAKRKEKKGSDSTIRRELNVLVAAANHAVKWGRLNAGNMPRIELPAEERGLQVKWLTKQQLADVISGAAYEDQKLHAFILIAYYTAARKKSIQDLTKFQVDVENMRINLMPADAKATKKRKPMVPIYPEILPVVKWLMETSTTGRLFGESRDFYRPFVALLARMGIKGHPHMLRHSRATHMLMDGESIYKVARLLGDTIATVERVYGHSSPEFLSTKSGV